MINQVISRDTNQTLPSTDVSFRSESLNGLKLATQIRIITLTIVGILLVFVQPAPAIYYNICILCLFAVLGVAHYTLARVNERPKISYLFMILDVSLLTFVLVALNREPELNPMLAEGLYPQMMFHYSNSVFYFLLIALTTLSYSSRLVLWTGIASASAWCSGVFWLTVGEDAWSPDATSTQDVMNHLRREYLVFLLPRFVEIVSILFVSTVLSLLIRRVHRLFRILHH